MDYFGTSGVAREDAYSGMAVDDEMFDLGKKRARDDGAVGDAYRGMSASPDYKIPRSVTEEEDDGFVSNLLREGAGMPTFEMALQPSHAPAAPSFEFNRVLGMNAAPSAQPASTMFQYPAAMLLEEAPAAASKMPTASAPPIEQPSHLNMPPVANAAADEDSKMPAIEVPQPPVEAFVERWTCDVCKSVSFETYDACEDHEASCKLSQPDEKKSDDELLKARTAEAAGALTSLSLCPSIKTQTHEEEEKVVPQPEAVVPDPEAIASKSEAVASKPRHPAINLVPSEENSSILSDYNNLLVRHVEFFFPTSENRLGLRCIHCKDSPTHITAATFFPSTIGSISSGLGTIGARHFGWGKCPSVPPEVAQQMTTTKKTSGLQTRDRSRVGLDAYCKNLAKKYGIFNDDGSGICWVEGTQPNLDVENVLLARKMSTSSRGSTKSSSTRRSSSTDGNSVASGVLARRKDSASADMRPFVPSDTKNFWECSGCRSIPFDFRAKGSVVFSVGEPSLSKIEGHLANCSGEKPLSIPRSSMLEPYYGEGVPSIKVKWDGKQAKRSSGKMRRPVDADSINPGVIDIPLCHDDEKEFTTEFAFFTVMQLKKCYLTKVGGSRGSAPLGFPGLACGHCAGQSNERRFFYTSADHLRNSFSHIPSHLAECDACPADVKLRLEELKQTRNSQKSSLKPGSHKIFIDRVWERMHGPVTTDEEDTDDDEGPGRSTSIVTTRRSALSNALAPTSTSLVLEEDKACTSDLIYFTLLQIDAYKNSGAEDAREIGLPGFVCRHCSKLRNGRKFFTTSSEHLGDLLVTTSDHLAICKEAPASLRSQIMLLKKNNEAQLLQLKEGEHTADSHNQLMDRVWRRLILERPKEQGISKTTQNLAPIQYPTLDPNCCLVDPTMQSLVTPFTFFAMQHVQPCNLQSKNSGNGARSAFDSGFPGLACSYCSGTPNSRRFFYRTADILVGNWAHIPTHLLACAGCPQEVKSSLRELKGAHQTLKHSLPRGSSKKFFNAVWDRLHGRALAAP